MQEAVRPEGAAVFTPENLGEEPVALDLVLTELAPMAGGRRQSEQGQAEHDRNRSPCHGRLDRAIGISGP
jgi:hypothetical protein